MAQIASINPSALMPLITPPTSQQTRQARRIYVGGIPSTASDDHIKAFFENAMNTLLTTAGAAPGAGIILFPLPQEEYRHTLSILVALFPLCSLSCSFLCSPPLPLPHLNKYLGIGSVVAIQMNHEKMFSFVEFRSPEEATTAMGLDGIIMDGQFPLKIS